MADNSRREQIIRQVISRLNTIEDLNHVVRAKQSHAQLKEFALTQFPVAAVQAGLPRPVEKKSNRRIAGVDKIISTLPVEVFVYSMTNVIDDNADMLISSLADDVWSKLYEDPTLGGLAIETLLTIAYDPEFWEPFLAFNMTMNIKYIHTTQGI